MEIKELDRQIKSGNVKRFYFFYGEEQFLMENKIKSIKKHFISPEFADMNYTVFEGKNVNVDDITAEIETFPIMSDMRVVVIRNTGILNNSRLTEYKKFKSYTEKIPETCIVIMTEGIIDKKKVKSYEWISDIGGLLEFKPLSMRELELWLEKWFESAGKSILDRDISYFIRTVGMNMSTLYNEAVKLIEFSGEKSGITRKDIDSITVKSTEFVVFDMIDDIISNKSGAVMNQLKILKERKESGSVILTLMTARLTEILMVKQLKGAGISNAEISKYFETPRPAFVVNKIYEQSRGFGERYLKRMIKVGFEYDVKIKSGKISDWNAINLFVAELIKK